MRKIILRTCLWIIRKTCPPKNDEIANLFYNLSKIYQSDNWGNVDGNSTFIDIDWPDKPGPMRMRKDLN
jgi:hypothetical protein